MSISSVGHAVVFCAAAATLASCGDTLLSAPSVGVTAERTPPGVAYEVLHSFGGGSADGEIPVANLIRFKNALYGTTAQGGATGNGTVFSITPSGEEKLLYSFKGGSDGGETSNGS